MKKINFSKAAILFISVISLSSCSSDDSTMSNGETTGDYWPMKVNNTWNFDNNGITEQMKITESEQIGGTTYYRLSDQGDEFGIPVWLTKKGATYYQKSDDFTTTQNGVTITIKGYQVPAFRDDLAVNETWSGTIRPRVTYSYNGQTGSLPTRVDYVGTITARDATEVINGITYTNIIKATLTAETNIDGQITMVDTEYWFAKDIGPVREFESTDGGIATERFLLNYTLN